MVLAIHQISFFEAESPLETGGFALVRGNHVAAFVKIDTLVKVIIEELYFELGRFDLDYLAS